MCLLEGGILIDLVFMNRRGLRRSLRITTRKEQEKTAHAQNNKVYDKV